ncbi:MAG TPA: hypothetical protein PKA27_04840 [Fimbriimonadaceae bacterium]|nr:hypothetical protein [Fimbriimonadaceae bacterium]
MKRQLVGKCFISFASVAIALLPSTPEAQLSEAMVRRKAVEFCEKAGLEVDMSSARVWMPATGMPSCSTPLVMVLFDHTGTAVALKNDGARRGGSYLAIRDESQLRAKGETVLRRMAESPEEFSEVRLRMAGLSAELEPSPDSRGRASAEYRQRPFGYAAPGGNSVLVEFDRSSGDLIMLSMVNHWTYEPPDIRVSALQAAEIARTSILADPIISRKLKYASLRAAVENVEALERSAKLGYQPPDSTFDRVRRVRTSFRTMLCYQFDLPNAYIVIDAKTGEKVGGGLGKTGDPQRPPESRPLVPLVLSGLILALVISLVRFARVYRRLTT